MASSVFLVFFVTAFGSPSLSSSCHPDQRDALSLFNTSFSIIDPFDSYHDHDHGFCTNTTYPKTASWSWEVDCCSWEGVSCDHLTGDVVRLDLSCASLRGAIHPGSSLFSLPRLRSLSLAGNDFIGLSLPPEISVLSQLTHLNLSSSRISGVVPAEISFLSKLVSLDLSHNQLEMSNPTMRKLVGNLTMLEELDLSSVYMSGVRSASLMNFTSSLTSLALPDSSLRGRFPDYVIQLPNLRKLDLSSNYDLHGTLPVSNWSSSLAFLSLAECYFTGEIPRSIGSLPRLSFLDLSGNMFSSLVNFENFSNLTNLRFLRLSGLSVLGEDAAYANPEFPQLQTLEMVSSKLTKFPSFLSRSKKLRSLYLSGNKIEEIPSWFWGIGIDTLEELYIENNLIRGRLQLPWKRLVHLCLQSNSFEGPLPIPARSVREFRVSQNQFNGSISPSICQLTSLVYLSLDRNNFTGGIPHCLGNQTGLLELDLSSNSLTGPLPRSLVNCTHLEALDVSYNNIIDSPPTWLEMSSLQVLNLKSNYFEGSWPEDIFLRLRSLKAIGLSSNNFEGHPPCPGHTTNSYMISSNNFSGEISCICNATKLWILDLSNNSLTGFLPRCLKNITANLKYLNIQMNEFHGVIPEIFPNESGLTSLDLSRNHLEGPLPRSLLNCPRLEVLDVGSNQIADSFPSWLEPLPLQVLSLRSNRFHGSISEPNGTRPFSELRILDLSSNSFDGCLPDDLILKFSGLMRMSKLPGRGSYMGRLGSLYSANGDTSYVTGGAQPEFYSVMINLKGVETEMLKIYIDFATLDMSSNHFVGELPSSIGLLKSLKGLNFSHNGFVGSIPASMGNLASLESLDLSSNRLVGEIPKELSRLTSLGFLSLSWNNLTGCIPSWGQLSTFVRSSFEGNPGLCGIPLACVCRQGQGEAEQRPDNGEDGEPGGGWFEWKFVAMGYASGMAIGVSLGYIVMETRRPLCLARMVSRLEERVRR